MTRHLGDQVRQAYGEMPHWPRPMFAKKKTTTHLQEIRNEIEKHRREFYEQARQGLGSYYNDRIVRQVNNAQGINEEEKRVIIDSFDPLLSIAAALPDKDLLKNNTNIELPQAFLQAISAAKETILEKQAVVPGNSAAKTLLDALNNELFSTLGVIESLASAASADYTSRHQSNPQGDVSILKYAYKPGYDNTIYGSAQSNVIHITATGSNVSNYTVQIGDGSGSKPIIAVLDALHAVHGKDPSAKDKLWTYPINNKFALHEPHAADTTVRLMIYAIRRWLELYNERQATNQAYGILYAHREIGWNLDKVGFPGMDSAWVARLKDVVNKDFQKNEQAITEQREVLPSSQLRAKL